jgi:hypothetical protein
VLERERRKKALLEMTGGARWVRERRLHREELSWLGLRLPQGGRPGGAGPP